MSLLGIDDSTIEEMKQLLQRIKEKKAKGEDIQIRNPKLPGREYFKGYLLVSEEEVNEMLDRTSEENAKILAKIERYFLRMEIINSFEYLVRENLEQSYTNT